MTCVCPHAGIESISTSQGWRASLAWGFCVVCVSSSRDHIGEQPCLSWKSKSSKTELTPEQTLIQKITDAVTSVTSEKLGM